MIEGLMVVIGKAGAKSKRTRALLDKAREMALEIAKEGSRL